MRPCIRGGNGVTSRTFQGVCACGFGRLGCRATRKRQAQHHTTKVRTARPQTLPSSHASANAAILWGPRAHHRGTGGDEVTQARRHTTSPQLCESHYTPAFLNEMAEDVVTQQHGTRARTVEQHRLRVCVCAHSFEGMGIVMIDWALTLLCTLSRTQIAPSRSCVPLRHVVV